MDTKHDTYSSVHLRERDKVLEEKYRKEISALETKISKLKWSNADVAKQVFEAQNRCHHLATSLGFRDIYDAQITIDSADFDASYATCHERIQKLESELEAEKARGNSLREKLTHAEKELANMKSSIKAVSDKATESLQQQLDDLQARYDDLHEVKMRAAEQFKHSFKTWRTFKQWLFSDAPDSSFSKKRKLIRECGPDWGYDSDDARIRAHGNHLPPPLGPTEMESDKENQTTPVPAKQPPRSGGTPLKTAESSRLNSSKPQLSIYKNRILDIPRAGPSFSPTVFLDPPRALDKTPQSTTRHPLSFVPVLNAKAPPSIKSPRSRVSGSSDTEDDSQAVSISHPDGTFKVPILTPMAPKLDFPSHMGESSETEEDADAPIFVDLTNRSSSPPKAEAKASDHTPIKTENSFLHALLCEPADKTNETSKPARKVRKISGNEFSVKRRTGADSSPDVGAKTYKVPTNTVKQTPKSRGPMPQSAPTTSSTSVRKSLVDYSAYKGRGRYGKGASDEQAEKTINEFFTIDPVKNGGVNFQYDDVVRNKNERRRMDAGDCECCRDYYEAVGPLPDRLQQPLWRSPSKHKNTCSKHVGPPVQDSPSSDRQANIEEHKKAISRHRHNWDRGKTPPNYWNIGFPDTQEVGNINEQAKVMHKEKMDQIEKTAMTTEGRYKRK